MTEPSTEKAHIAVTVVADTIVGKCHACGDRIQAPNKGLGRAVVATWRTRHQHLSESSTPPEQKS